jgi:antagonist of KipI
MSRPAITVLAAGLSTTVQDFGRPGYGASGISASGAADPLALHLGNALAGNPPGSAALEMTLTGGSFAFHQPCVIALAGSDFPATLAGKPIDIWRSYAVRAGDTLEIGATRSGARCYLCVSGGLVVPPFLGSASTHLASALGGFEGRALRKGDELQIGEATQSFIPHIISSSLISAWSDRSILRITEGPQSEWFPQSSLQTLCTAEFRVTEDSNRLGLRLAGPVLPATVSGELITEGVPLGALQITPSGQPILLFVEQQTTGGYPKIASVISADLFRIGQLRPRDTIRFARVSFAEARAAWIEMQRLPASPESLFA